MRSADLSGKFQEVLAIYLEAKENGASVDPQALLIQHPELADELREYFANERQFASAAGLSATKKKTPSDIPNKIRDGIHIGDYELLGEIARGGMGVVYRAKHASLQRLVALKMLLGGEFAGPDGLRRFRTEAELVAGLDHPQIVPIYDVGEHDGQAFFCMKLIAGPSLKQQIGWFDGKQEEAARLVIQLARAVHHAHQRGILHRDLKPGNILLEAFAPQRGAKKRKSAFPFVAYVADFGLAKRFQSGGKASQSTTVVGTPAYMAPEQATGKQALTVTADVYSLGAILYELLTGRPPFVGQNQLEILLQVVDKDPSSPQELRPNLDPDLAQICLKCLRKNPEERYPSADALALELEQWLEGEPLTVRAPRRSERLWRLCRRHPLAVFSSLIIASLSLLLAALSSGGNWYLNDLNAKLLDTGKQASESEQLAKREAENAKASAERERLARIEAENARAQSQQNLASVEQARKAESVALEERSKALEESRRLLMQQYVGNGQQLLARGDLQGAALWFGEALRQDRDDPARAEMHRIRLGTTLRQCPPLAQMWRFHEPIRMLRLSPLGDRLLAITKENAATLWDTKTGLRLGDPVRPENPITAAEFSPDGQWFVLVSSDNNLRLWSAASGQPHGDLLKHPQTVHAASFSADGKTLATACADKLARTWEVTTTKLIGKPLVHEQEVRLAVFHPDGKKLLTVSENHKSKKGELRIWDLGKQSHVALPWPVGSGIRTAGYGRDGKRIYAISAGHQVRMWESAAAHNVIAVPPGLQIKGEHGVWFAPGLDKVVQIGETEVKIIDLPGGNVAHTLRAPSPIGLAQFGPAGRHVLVGSLNGGVRLWSLESGQWHGPTLPAGQTTTAVRFSANEKWLAVAGSDYCVRLWHLDGSDRDKFAAIPKNKGLPLAISPDGKRALLAQSASLAIWDFAQGRTVGAPLPYAGSLIQARWSPDGRNVAVVANRDEVRLWEVPSGKPLTPILKCEDAAHLRFLDESAGFAVWGKSQLRLWNLAGKAILTRRLNKSTTVYDCDGKRLALWKNGTVHVQDLGSEKSHPLLKLAGRPDSFRFSPNPRIGVAVFADGSMRIWDLQRERQPITPFFWNGEPIRQVVFGTDGRFLASAGASDRLRVWDAATGQPLSPALSVSASIADLAFQIEGANILAATTDGRIHRWNLRGLEGDPADILREVRLAAGQEIHAGSVSLIPIEPAALHQLWLESHR